MGMLAADLWILRSYAIHRGGVVATEVPAGSSRMIAFAAITTRRVDSETTGPIIAPP